MRSVPPGGRCLWRSLHPVTCSWLNQRWALSVSGIGGAAGGTDRGMAFGLCTEQQ